VASHAGERRANADPIELTGLDALDGRLVDLGVARHDRVAGGLVDDVERRHATDQPIDEGLGDLLRLLAGDPRPDIGAAVLLTGDDVLGHVHQAAGQVPGVGGAQRGVGQSLAGSVAWR